MVVRLIPQTILNMEDLILPEVLKDLAARPKGLVLVLDQLDLERAQPWPP